MSSAFDAPFRRLLAEVVARVGSLRAREDEDAHARRRVRADRGTFAGHRRYSLGDDLRRVDWNAYARSRELFVKLFEEEERRGLVLLLDCTPSMRVGTPSRLQGAQRLAALVGAVALARVGTVRVCQPGKVVSLEGGARIDALLGALDELRADQTDPGALWSTVLSERLRGRVLWISDFAGLDEAQAGLRRLAPRRRDLLGLLPELAEDRLPEQDGWLALVDAESGERVRTRVDAQLRRAVALELQRLARGQDELFARAGVPLLRVPLPPAESTSVAAWLGGGWLDRV